MKQVLSSRVCKFINENQAPLNTLGNMVGLVLAFTIASSPIVLATVIVFGD